MKAQYYYGQYVQINAAPSSEERGSTTGSGLYKIGSTVKLTAIPNEGFLFHEWNNGSASNPLIFTAAVSGNYVASFIDA